MHSYSINSDERLRLPLIMAIISILLAWAIQFLHTPWWFDAPSVFGFYGIIIFLFNKKIWKYNLLHKFNLIRTPIIEGEWKGTLTSSSNHAVGEKDINVKITQTWTGIKIFLETDTSYSFSFTGSIVLDQFDKPILYYQYQSHPKNNAVETMHVHYGSVHAKIIDGAIIEAEYYSGRDRQNFGTFKIKKI